MAAPRVRLIRTKSDTPFPEYRLLGLVGQGQFAQVYCAMHRQSGRLVAIKQTRHAPEQPSQEPFVLGELCHPNIVCCEAIAISEGSADDQTSTRHQFVLDYCEAGTLRSQLDMAAPTGLSQSLIESIAVDILRGLDYIHGQQVIHGDLKPENILLTYQLLEEEQKTSRLTARISDFGSARFVDLPNQSRKEIGSPTYAAPERFDGQSSPASDLYSAGVILYELLLGDRPFSGSSDSLKEAHQTQAVSFPSSTSPAIEQFLSRALHKYPNARFSSAGEMLSAFQKLRVSEIAPPVSQSQISVRRGCIGRSPSTFSTRSNILYERISADVYQLLAKPDGCFIVSDVAVYWLCFDDALQTVAQFDRPTWIAISPNSRWLVAVPKRLNQLAQTAGQWIPLSPSASSNICANYSRTVSFCVKPWLSSQVSEIGVFAISQRYVVRVLASPNADKSYLECITRKGKRVALLPLNVSLSHAACSSDSARIVAISEQRAVKNITVLLISLRPFQVRSVALASECLGSAPRGLGVFSWGFAVIDDVGCLLLDRAARPVGRFDMVGICAIAPLADSKVAIAVSSNGDGRSQKDPLEKASSSGSSLLEIDLSSLGLDLIF